MRRVLFAQICAKNAKCTVTFGRVSVRGDSPEKWTVGGNARKGTDRGKQKGLIAVAIMRPKTTISRRREDFENLVKTLFKPC